VEVDLTAWKTFGWYLAKQTRVMDAEPSEAELEAFINGIKAGASAEPPMPLDQAMPRIQQILQARLEVKNQAESADNIEAGMDFLAEVENREGVMKTDSGLLYLIEEEGYGAKPGPQDQVEIHYHGTLIDGTVFDSSVQRGQTATFGVNQVIPGFSEGLQLIREGGKITLFIPQELAYGPRATGSIPAGSTLIFEVELMKVIAEETSSADE